MKPLIEIKDLINASSKKIFISMHQNPDADAIGSSLALAQYLIKKGHQVTVVSPNEFPEFLKWLPGCEQVLIFESQKKEVLHALEEADMQFSLDYNNFNRTKDLAEYLYKSSVTRVLIDHHLYPGDYFDYGKSDTTAASTALLVYEFVHMMGDFSLIDIPMAQCIYAGTMTDTGSFRFPSTSARVHRMVAHLMDLGLKHAEVHEAIYDNYGENRLRFMGKLFSDELEILHDYHTAIISVPKELGSKFDLKPGDTEGLVNMPLAIKGIYFSVFLTEKKGEIRMSFRSKGEISVNQFAARYFEGGGHKNAAGGVSHDSLENTLKKLKEAIKENKDLFNP